MKKHVIVFLLATTFFYNGCTSTKLLSDNEALAQFETLASLQKMMSTSDTDYLEIFSQISYTESKEALSKAKSLARKNNVAANEVASEGIKALKKAKAQAELAKDVFSEVLSARSQAIDSGAFDLASEKVQDIEEQLKFVALKLEQGQQEAAKIKRPELIRAYNAIEIASLKRAAVDKAKHIIAKADEYGASKYAEKTFKLAENELAIAVKLIEGDKSRKLEAEQHAERAIELAEQAMGITDTAKEFKENDFSFEEIVLWHQGQLQKAVKPLNANLKVNRPNHHIISEINASISELMSDKVSLRELAEKDKALLKQRLTGLEQERKQLESAQKNKEEQDLAKRKKLEFVQNLFEAKEANVYLQKDDVLIRAQGFYFPSGASEIDSRNFSLLQKIAKAISEYPNATILVTGHTDSIGKGDLNLRLSKERAQKVAKFLNEFGGISGDRITVDGFGESKPVESNDTQEGRAANRRVEILIQNKPYQPS